MAGGKKWSKNIIEISEWRWNSDSMKWESFYSFELSASLFENRMTGDWDDGTFPPNCQIGGTGAGHGEKKMASWWKYRTNPNFPDIIYHRYRVIHQSTNIDHLEFHSARDFNHAASTGEYLFWWWKFIWELTLFDDLQAMAIRHYSENSFPFTKKTLR